MSSVTLGDKVRCRLTGFRGIATARLIYLNGCIRIQVTAPSKKNEEPKDVWIDEAQLETVGSAKSAAARPTGGDRIAPPRLEP